MAEIKAVPESDKANIKELEHSESKITPEYTKMMLLSGKQIKWHK